MHPLSVNDVKENIHKHYFNECCIGFQRVSNRLINNGKAVNTETPHKNFEAMGYYYNDSVYSQSLLVGPMIFVGADGFISDINSDIEKRKEQSLGNIYDDSISYLVQNGGIKVECKDIADFVSLMRKREIDFGTHQGEHLGFKNGKMEQIEYKRNEEYYNAMEDLPNFMNRAFKAIEDGNLTEFLNDL